MLPVHTVEVMPGSTQAQKDRVMFANLNGVTNDAGGGAGEAVTVAVLLSLPVAYSVVIDPGQDATWYISGKSENGFTVNLNPRLAADTLGAGAIDILVFA